ncbi:carbohydrate kinase family protein [Luteitalea sp. TBR-22]|uniref:carbohydrate kinase family protein n=1 Tax=Luteitalea sp. TBR-22 TaxID=2802971 RepID=UPI001EF41B2E|nr:PfkB family carbohydrate kinase [Luteitalea sp. TBR-22]
MPTSASDARWDVVGLGANSVDFVYRLPAVPQASGTFAKMRISRETISCGGQMTTALVACARFGLRAKYIGATGTDDNGRRIRAELAHHSVDCTDAIIKDARNQYAVIMVDEVSGERIILWDRDEMLHLRDHEIPERAIVSARLLHVDDVDQEAAIVAATIARDAGLVVTSDIDRLTPRTIDLVKAVTVPIFAEHVPAGLTGAKDLESALRQLRESHDGLLCATIGAEGAVALDGTRFIHSPGFKVHAVDTTGAGDVFRAGFIYGTLQGWRTEHVLRFANAAAGLSCTRPGAIGGVPALDEIEALLETAPA